MYLCINFYRKKDCKKQIIHLEILLQAILSPD